jgi:myo-inositol 2-dehydrogenase/D-chiro-inositol 1-dehydrogenase
MRSVTNRWPNEALLIYHPVPMDTSANNPASRRDFLRTSLLAGSALAAPALMSERLVARPISDTLRVGLIGCGERGSGAASQALYADNNVVLTAMGDAFENQLQISLENLQKMHPDKVKVTPGKCFVGLDSYLKVIFSGVDVVLLATPPGFRPIHLKAAVEAGKHVFCEKPMATDAPGVRSVLASVKAAKEKNLSLVAGFFLRYADGNREYYRRIHAGAIGDLRAVYARHYSVPVRGMASANSRPAGMGDLEWQMSNWYNFTWLSGDGYVEAACHGVDRVGWALKDQSPLKAVAVGGRQTPNNQGNIYDHMFVAYEFPNDVFGYVAHRQIARCYVDSSDEVIGTAGFGKFPTFGSSWMPFIKSKENWRYPGPDMDLGDIYVKSNYNGHNIGPKTNPWQRQQNELFASIRSGQPINDGEWMANSTMMAIMGRMAAYTGQEVTWEQALNSQEKLVPDQLDWKMKLDIAPMAVPGITKLI